jgi:hypothetical protein
MKRRAAGAAALHKTITESGNPATVSFPPSVVHVDDCRLLPVSGADCSGVGVSEKLGKRCVADIPPETEETKKLEEKAGRYMDGFLQFSRPLSGGFEEGLVFWLLPQVSTAGY